MRSETNSRLQVQVPAKGGGFGANYVLTRVCNVSGLEKPQTRVCGRVSKAERKRAPFRAFNLSHISHLNQGQSCRSHTGIPPPAVGWLWLAQVPHAQPSVATPWPPGSAAGGALLCWWPLCQYSRSRHSPGSFARPVPPYGNTDRRLLAHHREVF